MGPIPLLIIILKLFEYYLIINLKIKALMSSSDIFLIGLKPNIKEELNGLLKNRSEYNIKNFHSVEKVFKEIEKKKIILN